MISMKKVNYAAIDIGSNAVRLLIKCVNEENARIVFGEDADEKIAAIKNFKPDTAA